MVVVLLLLLLLLLCCSARLAGSCGPRLLLLLLLGVLRSTLLELLGMRTVLELLQLLLASSSCSAACWLLVPRVPPRVGSLRRNCKNIIPISEY